MTDVMGREHFAVSDEITHRVQTGTMPVFITDVRWDAAAVTPRLPTPATQDLAVAPETDLHVVMFPRFDSSLLPAGRSSPPPGEPVPLPCVPGRRSDPNNGGTTRLRPGSGGSGSLWGHHTAKERHVGVDCAQSLQQGDVVVVEPLGSWLYVGEMKMN